MPCGEGRHSIELAARGYVPTGVDCNARALAVAERNARERGVRVEFVRADMRDFTPPGDQLDAALVLLRQLRVLQRRRQPALRRQRRARARARRPLLDRHARHGVAVPAVSRNARWDYMPDGTRVLEESRYDLESRRVETTWTFLRESGTVSSQLVDPAVRLRRALRSAARRGLPRVQPCSRPALPRRSSSARAGWRLVARK